ncbi:MAG: hypothetical protein PHQ09_07650 [Actinomycetota bacterium]|nr:hypothetical protein [Actinomycetota bacterium]
MIKLLKKLFRGDTMKHSYLADENQLGNWVSAANNIKSKYGLIKALGYIIGEKFYNLSKDYRNNQERMASIEEERKEPDYNPEKIVSGGGKFIIDLDKEYEKAEKEVAALKEILTDFSEMIKGSFTRHEIENYFNSHIRLGTLGHILTEKEHKEFVEKEVVEHSLETEINDSLILGDMMKYFNLN